jgi:hypothetical protein
MLRTISAACIAVITSSCTGTSALGTYFRGHYYWGHEVETFHPCGSKQAFWVVGDATLLQPLRDQAAKVLEAQGKPYLPIYVEVSAVVEGKAKDGFAADYDGVYRVTAVHVVNSSSPADCQAHR